MKKKFPKRASRSSIGSPRDAEISGTGFCIQTGHDSGLRSPIHATYSGENHCFCCPGLPITGGSQRCSSNHALTRGHW